MTSPDLGGGGGGGGGERELTFYQQYGALNSNNTHIFCHFSRITYLMHFEQYNLINKNGSKHISKLIQVQPSVTSLVPN